MDYRIGNGSGRRAHSQCYYIRIVGKDGSNQKAYSREDGTYKFRLDLGIDYVMMAGCKGFLNSRGEFTSDAEERNETYGLDFILAAINKPVIVDLIGPCRCLPPNRLPP